MGLVNRKKLYVRWTQRNLRSGDEVLLRVVDRKSVDRYKIIRQHDEKKDLESMKRHVRKMAKSLGMAILENPKPKGGSIGLYPLTITVLISNARYPSARQQRTLLGIS